MPLGANLAALLRVTTGERTALGDSGKPFQETPL